MKTCAICGKSLPSGRSKYCGDQCYFASKRGFNLRRYHSDPAQAEAIKAAWRVWRLANRDHYNATQRERYARKKAERFARVLNAIRGDVSP